MQVPWLCWKQMENYIVPNSIHMQMNLIFMIVFAKLLAEAQSIC
jgi:hypothetical protein